MTEIVTTFGISQEGLRKYSFTRIWPEQYCALCKDEEGKGREEPAACRQYLLDLNNKNELLEIEILGPRPDDLRETPT
jgi:hypothetical protein